MRTVQCFVTNKGKTQMRSSDNVIYTLAVYEVCGSPSNVSKSAALSSHALLRENSVHRRPLVALTILVVSTLNLVLAREKNIIFPLAKETAMLEKEQGRHKANFLSQLLIWNKDWPAGDWFEDCAVWGRLGSS